jgi:hypothetical protein
MIVVRGLFASKSIISLLKLFGVIRILNGGNILTLCAAGGGLYPPVRVLRRMQTSYPRDILKLIRKMSGIFSGDKSFETSLRLVLKDTSGQTLEKMHLKPARHGGVFHFVPDRFAEAIAKTPLNDCVFLSSIGQQRGSLHYSFADTITAEMMGGGSLQDERVIIDMMENMLDLVKKLTEHSENFIVDQLHGWGFVVGPS